LSRPSNAPLRARRPVCDRRARWASADWGATTAREAGVLDGEFCDVAAGPRVCPGGDAAGRRDRAQADAAGSGRAGSTERHISTLICSGASAIDEPRPARAQPPGHSVFRGSLSFAAVTWHDVGVGGASAGG
jgi:hypothetical protein